MDINVSDFDQYKGNDVKKIKLTNDNDVSISVLTMGAILHEFIVPTTNGDKNLVLNYDQTSKYYDNPFYVGMTIGRTGGRIKDGKMPLKGKMVKLPTNEGNNTLHGGPNGFSDHLWNYTTQEGKNDLSAVLYQEINSDQDNYLGNLKIKVTFNLSNNNELKITYTGISDKDTFFNPTCHAYFNLGNSDTILNHQLFINSSYYLDVDSEKIPTGNLLTVDNTPFDFTKPKLIRDGIEGLQNTNEKGFDDIFKISDFGKIAELKDVDSGNRLEIYSDRNGLVCFTANSFDNSLDFKQGSGNPYMGIALEAQTLSDTHNHEGFGDVTLPANTEKSYTISYRYYE